MQGGFCAYRAVAIWHELNREQLAENGGTEPIRSDRLLRHFLQARWKGLLPVTWGDQLRQQRLDQIIYLDTLAIDRLPLTTDDESVNDGLVLEHPAVATESQ